MTTLCKYCGNTLAWGDNYDDEVCSECETPEPLPTDKAYRIIDESEAGVTYDE